MKRHTAPAAAPPQRAKPCFRYPVRLISQRPSGDDPFARIQPGDRVTFDPSIGLRDGVMNEHGCIVPDDEGRP